MAWGMISRQPWNTVTAALIGAAGGFLFALFLELTGHPPWYVLAMLIGATAPSVFFALNRNPRTEAFRDSCQRLPRWSRFSLVLLMIIVTLAANLALGVNPRDCSYLPLLIPVVASAVLFGFGEGLFAVVLTAIAADYFFALPEYDFAITEWKDALGLAVFAILGALAALAIDGLRDIGKH